MTNSYFEIMDWKLKHKVPLQHMPQKLNRGV